MMQRVRAFWRHFTYNYEQGGLYQITGKILFRIRHWGYSEDRWLVYEKALGSEKLVLDAGMQWLELEADDLRRHEYFKMVQFPEMIEHRLAQGAVCHGLLLDGRLANLGWTQLGILELDSGAVLRDKDAGGIFDCYTMPEYRGRGLYPKSIVGMMEKLQDAGAKKAMIGVDPDNVASMRGIEKAGFGSRFLLTRRRIVGRTQLLHSSSR